jgi:hypothetical protein
MDDMDCDNCGAPMRWETSHSRCDRCGYIRPCCEGAPAPEACRVSTSSTTGASATTGASSTGSTAGGNSASKDRVG